MAPCHFGLESVLKKEITDLGYEIIRTEDGRITYSCDEAGIARSNVFLRTCERVLIQAGRFHAETFDELFEGVKSINWEQYIPEDGRFWVKKASSVKSRLFSPSDIQSITKKAMVEKLKQTYHCEWFSETGSDFPVRVFIYKDEVIVGLDTSGESLHKRGYRAMASAAPISETLAAALIRLTPWNRSRILVDPFCGSGTFPIEAALMAAHIAPGMDRSFTAEGGKNLIPESCWQEAREEARDLVRLPEESDIQAYDLDGEIIKAARENARAAGVDSLIHFQQRDVKELSHPKKYGFIVTNPPYGERLEEKAALPELYQTFGQRFRALEDWSAYVITSYDGIEQAFGRKADKNRKIYNGMMKTYFYEFRGGKPPTLLRKGR